LQNNKYELNFVMLDCELIMRFLCSISNPENIITAMDKTIWAIQD